jgi:hypothetical protein
MKTVLSDAAADSLYETGLVRTPIRLPPGLIERILKYYGALPLSVSNFGAFAPVCISQFSDNADEKFKVLFPELQTAATDEDSTELYDKSIFSTSPMLGPVLDECIVQGLRDHLGDVDLLAGHDIYFESARNRSTFGFHYDPNAFSIFHQSGDDVTIYIALQTLSPETGGRLLVERHSNRGLAFEERNKLIKRFADLCAKYVEPDSRGLIRREDVFASDHRREIANAFVQMLEDRAAFPMPSMGNLKLIDAEAGEVFLFNNKNYHAVEPWKLDDVPRRNYAIRTYPMFDFGLAPPATFLNDQPCNRFLIGDKDGTLQAIDPYATNFRFSPLPAI